MITAALLFAGFVPIRDPDTLAPITWPTDQVTVMIQRDGSDDVDDGSDLTAIRNALATWSAVPCSRFRFIDGGLVAGAAIGQDGVNRITFLESNWPGGANGAGAFTERWRDESTSPDTFIEFDIRINGEAYPWATDASAMHVDIQAIVVHELGHAIGLAHSPIPEATMYFFNSYSLTHARTLEDDDRAGVCFLYPTNAFSCTSDRECPLYDSLFGGSAERTHCVNGSCVLGAVGFGEACFDGAHCTSGQCETDPANPPGGEPGACTTACAIGGGDCPSGSFCSDAGDGPRCYLGRDDCAKDEDCASGDMCKRDLDGRYRCLTPCTDDPACGAIAGTICHLGFCRTPGPKGGGETCAHGLECATLRCTLEGVQPRCFGDPIVSDAGIAEDAGLIAAPDGGTIESESEPEPESDCSCTAIPARPAPALRSAWWSLWALLHASF